MKRIIREVVTMIRIERWLVREDTPDIPALGKPEVSATASANNPDSDAVDVTIEETTIEEGTGPLTSSPNRERVVSQRVLNVHQWEIKHEGEPQRHQARKEKTK